MRVDEIVKIKQTSYKQQKNLDLEGYEDIELLRSDWLPDNVRWFKKTEGDTIKLGVVDINESGDLGQDEEAALSRYQKLNRPQFTNVINRLISKRERLKKARRLIGYIVLSPDYRFPISKTFSVDAISVSSDYANRGMAKALYRLALDTLGFTLISGYEQTPGGRRNWASLAKMPEVDVIGYIEIEDFEDDEESLEADVIDKIMSMGGQHMGSSTTYNNRHYFAFDVDFVGSGKELEAGTAKKLKLYTDEDDRVHAQVGMYAQWNR